MAWTVATFKAVMPEFQNTPNALVQAALDEAFLELDPDIWDDKFDTGWKYLTAHKLAVSPYGQNARMTETRRQRYGSTYEMHYRKLMRMVAVGFRSV